MLNLATIKLLTLNLLIAICALFICACQNTAKPNTTQPIAVFSPQLWNDNWEFFRANKPLSYSEALANKQWQTVKLPHTAKIEPLLVNDQWQGEAWYKKTLTYLPEWENKKVFIDFEAAMTVADVYINGHHLKQHLGGYLPFSVEVSQFLNQQNNILVVKLNNEDNPIIGPKPLKILDFNTYGGLYRNVWLRVKNTTHITNAVNANKKASGGIFVQPQIAPNKATLNIKTHIVHAQSNTTLSVTHQLFDQGRLVSSTTQILNSENATEFENSQSMDVNHPKLWSPQTPNLYKLYTQIRHNGQLVDDQITTVGIREFKFVDNQLYINGEKTFLRGVNRHQEYPYIGYALSDAAQYRDGEKIKAAGFDYVRLSHYPHSTAFMNAADELGLVLIDAILGWQYVSEDPEFQNHVVQTCRDMIRRDRNHPSVLAWECSLNESWMQEPLIDRFQQVVHEEYPSPKTFSAGWQTYGYDIYLQARQHRLDHYKKPTKPYVVSEYGDWEYYAMNAGLNQDSWGDLLQAERSSRQLLSDGEKRLQQQAFNIIEAHNDNFNTPAFADGYWVMFDYNRGYADDLEASGIMSIHRQPKFSYYFYQSQRSSSEFNGNSLQGHMAHIASYWQKDSPLNFFVFSNADTVKLTLNGKAVATAKPDPRFSNLTHPPFYFELPEFEPGTLIAKAYVEDELVATHSVTTPGSADKLKITLDPSSIKPQVSTKDSVFIYAEILDAKGRPTHTNGEVTFATEGDIKLISPKTVTAEGGSAAALVQIGASLDGAIVTAELNHNGKMIEAHFKF